MPKLLSTVAFEMEPQAAQYFLDMLADSAQSIELLDPCPNPLLADTAEALDTLAYTLTDIIQEHGPPEVRFMMQVLLPRKIPSRPPTIHPAPDTPS